MLVGLEPEGSSNSLSDSVSTNLLDLLRFFDTGFAVADFLGTTLGGLLGTGFLPGMFFFFEGFISDSDSSSLMGRGLTFVFVTNPDFFTSGG